MWEFLQTSHNKILGALVGFLSLFTGAPANAPAPVPLSPGRTTTVTTTKPLSITATTTAPTAKVSPAKTPSKPAPANIVPAKTTPVKTATTTVTKPATSTPPAFPQTAPASTTALAAPQIPLDFETINKNTKDALVNIICIPNNNSLNPITGTGVVIDPRGVIMTNAHVAQYFLLRDFVSPSLVECTIRSGNPASAAYTAKLMYISPAWIRTNAHNLTSSNPLGTGENDFALLLITGRSGSSLPFPSSFSFVQPEVTEKDYVGQRVLAAGYAAGFLGGLYINQSLYSTSAIATVKESLSYTGDTYDFMALSGTVVAQRGSSGGPVVSETNKLIGIISTVTADSNTADRELGTISLSHINRSLTKQSGSDLASLLEGDIHKKAEQFNNLIALDLTTTLVNALLKK